MKFDRMGCFAYSHEENTACFLREMMFQICKNKTVLTSNGITVSNSMDLNQEKVGQTFKCIMVEGGHFVGKKVTVKCGQQRYY
jgi:ribosomal protein S12 methylthiotransferase